MTLYVGSMLRLAREMTDNIGWSQNSSGNPLEGITDDLLLEFMNEAQELLQSRIIAVYPSEFVEEEEISLVADQEAYTISDNVFLNNKIVSVEYSRTGNDEDYNPLPQLALHQRATVSGEPRFYIRRSGQILVNPIPPTSQGKIRVNYYRTLDRLDKRRGKISSVTSTTIVLANDSDLDNYGLGVTDYISTCAKIGTSKDYGVVASSYNSTTRTITIPSQTLTAAANDYVVLGRYSGSHSKLPDNCNRYIRTYCQLRAFHKDSSSDEVNEMKILKDMLTDIIDGWSELSEDIMDVPILDENLE